MKESIQIFENANFGQIRTSISASGEPLFCLVDVARALNYKNPAKAVIDHCRVVSILGTPTNGGVQQIKFGREGDVFRLIMKSKMKEAEMFQDWVCDEVLPAIRKTGGYMVARPDETPEQIMARAMMIAKDAIDRMTEQVKKAESKIIKLQAINIELTKDYEELHYGSDYYECQCTVLGGMVNEMQTMLEELGVSQETIHDRVMTDTWRYINPELYKSRIQKQITTQNNITMVNEKFSFKKGWSQIKQCDVKKCREQLMEVFNITTRAGFCKRLNGEIEPRISHVQAVEKIFAKYGIKDVWGLA